jgi:cytochrome c biogenesis protein CcdA
VQEAKTRTGWLASALFFTLGNLLVAAVIGAVVGDAGGAILQALTNRATVLTLSAIVYSLMGLFALGYALVEFGFLRLPVVGLHGGVPDAVARLGYYPRSFVLGLVVGGGFTVGCPFPTYQVILGWIAVTGSFLTGAVVLGAYGVGRALPVFIVGLVLFAGVRPQVLTGWIQDHRALMRQLNGLGMTILAAFLLTYWGLLLTLRVLVH